MAAQLYSDWAPGPQSQPLVKRSKYLADALKNLNAQSTNIQTGGELGSRLLASAILQLTDRSNDKRLGDAQKADVGSEADAMIKALGGGQTAAPSPAAPIAPVAQPEAAPQALAQAIAPPTAAPITASPLPPISNPNRSNGSSPLGVRQNNPTNIRDTAIPWQGANGSAGGFEMFDTPENGIRAGARNLQNKQKLHGLDTIEGIIGDPKAGWAPASDNNNVPAYVSALAKATGYDPKARLNLSDPNTNQALLAAIIQHENGQNPYSPDQIKGGVMSALGGGQPVPQAAPQQAAMPIPTAQPQAMAPPPMSAPPQAQPAPMPQAPGQQQLGNSLAATPGEIQLIQQLFGRGDPRSVQAARDMASKIQMRQTAPHEYETSITRGGQSIRTDKSSGQQSVSDIPGFRAPLEGNFQYGPNGAAAPIQGTQTRVMSAKELGLPAPEGTYFNVEPSGKISQALAPPQGLQANGQGGFTPMSGSASDPTSPVNRLQGLKEFRGELKPILDQATALKRNIDSVRTGYQQQNGSGDIAMVNGLQKLIDEGVVREGDVNLQLSAQGIKGGIAGALGFLQSSGKFDPEIRSKIFSTASQLYGSINSTYKDRATAYRGIVDRTYGAGAFNDVIPPETIQSLGWNGEVNAQPRQSSPGAGASVGGGAANSAYAAALAERQRRQAAKGGR